MPCHNEGREIYRNLHETVKTMNELKKFNIDYEVILVDDGSTDNTLKEARLVNSNKIKIISYISNHGKGYALKYGFQFATGDLVTFIDSDLEIHPRQLLRFVSYMYEHNVDIVIGSKSHPDSIVNYPFKRRVLSKLYHLFVNLVFGLRVGDTQSGMKLICHRCAEYVLPKVVIKRYAFDLELLVVAQMLGFRIKEAPIEVRYNFNKSSIGFSSVWPILQDTLSIAYRKYIMRYYDNGRNISKIKKIQKMDVSVNW